MLKDQDLGTYVRNNPGRGPLLDQVPDETNTDSLGNNRKNSYVAGAKDLDPVRAVGPNPTPDEANLLNGYADRLNDDVLPSVRQELEQLVNRFPGARTSSRAKNADALVDKVQRMTSGTGGRAPRPNYQVGDVIDAVGARITARITDQLADIYQAVKDHSGTGDTGRILEIENMYAQPKATAPLYRVIQMIIKSEIGGIQYTFELQLNTQRAATGADLMHNTLYKPYVQLSSQQAERVESMVGEAAALDQAETRGVNGGTEPTK